MNHTDREAEEQYLEKTLDVVESNLANYGSEVSRMQEQIDEMLGHYHDNNVELWTLLNNTITLNEHMKRALARNEKARLKPYFGRIVFRDETLGKEESLYIGKGGISRDNTNWLVVDWRAPVANAYYENGLGKCSYTAPGGREIPIDLQLKRTYEIEGGRLLDYFDTEVVANDDLLTKYLSKNKEAVLGEIVATIQKEQNEIIRKSPYHNVIVQGVAGSGKTTVAMHRISFILYNYKERFRPEDFYIVGSNRILLNYITGVLPDLDVYGVRQMTMEQLFIRLLYEDWDEKRYRVRPVSGSKDVVKGTQRWFLDLEAFIRRLEQETIRREDIFLYPRQFVEGLQDGKNGIYDRREEDKAAGRPLSSVRLIEKEAVERYVDQNPFVSIQSKINMLNERLAVKIREAFLGKGVTYTEEEKKAILRAYRGYYGPNRWKRPIYEIYEDFLAQQSRKGMEVEKPGDSFDVYDLAALALLYKWVKETEVISEAHHIVVDEAQDFGMMAYCVLHACIRDCTYTVMGDVSQNIRFGYGLGDWGALQKLLLADPMDSFGVLRKSYRNTVEISDFATNILRHGSFAIYPVEPIIRHGSAVAVEERRDAGKEAFAVRAAKICRRWQEQGYDTIAVVCRNAAAAREAAELLSKRITIMESDLEKADFGNGILVLPVEYTKGLEFDAVLIWDPTREDYPVDDGHAKLLYVAATRALHELQVLHRGNLTGLIADPASADNGKNFSNAADESCPEGQGAKGLALQNTEITETRQDTGQKLVKDAAKAAESAAAARHRSWDAADEAKGQDRRKSCFLQKEKSSEVPESAPGRVRPRARLNSKIVAVAAPKAAGSDSAGKIAAQDDLSAFPGGRRSEMAIPYGQPAASSRLSAPNHLFGDMPAMETLRPAGHAKISMGVRWAFRQADGLYLQSQYGILRISPISPSILRITFAKGAKLADGTHPLIAVDKVEKNWNYRDSTRTLEFSTGEVILRVDKTSGSMTYLDGQGKTLLAERKQESRQLENRRQWLFLEWQKGEQLFAVAPDREQGVLSLRNSAFYISDGQTLPFLLSDRGYGILTASLQETVCCDIPVYGSYLATQGEQQDYYFLAGKQQRNILNACAYLRGNL